MHFHQQLANADALLQQVSIFFPFVFLLRLSRHLHQVCVTLFMRIEPRVMEIVNCCSQC